MGRVDAELARARDLRDVSCCDQLKSVYLRAHEQRDLFLRDLVEQSVDSRLSDQDAEKPSVKVSTSEDRVSVSFPVVGVVAADH